ncbi:MAG: tRNA pseudouridine(55) synthase TruB [Bacteroidia bacterium]
MDFVKGEVLLIDKPLGWTSFRVVDHIRWHIRKKLGINKIKVGHAGTLDPLASGLLIICTGKETKNIESYQNQKKEYIGTIRIGATTPSYDLETEINQTFPTEHLDEELLLNTTKSLTGEIMQKPPIFSAKKIDGERAYEAARRGDDVEMPARKVTIETFDLTNINLPDVDFRIVCSKGTYIRSIAHDFGIALNSGAHLTSLRRTKIGEFAVENAYTIERLIEAIEQF